jgi:hypothetical protein
VEAWQNAIVNWRAGSLEAFGNIGSGWRHIKAVGIEVRKDQLAALVWFKLDDREPKDSAVSGDAPRRSSGGRKRADWWPAFVAELAVEVHENGIPAGHEANGSEALINAIFARMSKRGIEEGSRSAVQPVINAVLARMRELGYANNQL